MDKYKAVISQEEATYYVGDSDIVKFISENGSMPWNKTCKYVQENDIVSSEGDVVCWTRDHVFDENQAKYYNENAIYWMKEFFNAHPFMNKIMVVFDS